MSLGDGVLHDVGALRSRVAELEAELDRHRVAADELAVAKLKLEALLSSLPIVIWEVDAHGIVTGNEGHGLSLLGIRPSQPLGTSVRDMYAEAPEILENIERGLAGETFSASNEAGGVRFENYYFPRRAPDGTPCGLLGLTWVVTLPTEIAAERQQIEARVQDKQKQESLAVLAGGIAHDFNNLLLGSLGHADLALRKVMEGSELAGHLHEIVRASERAAELCRQLLAYAGRGQFIVKTEDLNALVEDSMRLIELTIAKTSTLHAELMPKLPRFRGDATQIVQVLINLLKNASDASEGQPSTIHIRTGLRYVEPDERRLTVVAPDTTAGTFLFVSIRDQGVGMRPEAIGRIFDPFYSTKQTGRGLGLAAVTGIVRSHGGMLEVESELGVGTTMVVYLPVLPGAQGRPMEAHGAPARQNDVTRAVVLVVDDEPGPRGVTTAMLELAGCKVLQAANGREGVELYRTWRSSIDVVLMDLVMPHMDGAQALRELRAIDADAKVILVSGFAEVETTRQLAGLRPSAFLHKPYRYEQLLETLAAVRGRT